MAAHGTELGEVHKQEGDKMAVSELLYDGIIISDYKELNCRIIDEL
jgi:hypothetical protein